MMHSVWALPYILSLFAIYWAVFFAVAWHNQKGTS